MTDDEVEGAARTIGGRVQDAVGGLTGDPATQMKGKINQARGESQSGYGQAVDEVRGYTADQPIAALLIALGVGAVLGFWIRGR